MSGFNRRHFLKASGLTILPVLVPAHSLLANTGTVNQQTAADTVIRLYGDGILYEPSQYIEQLQQVNSATPIEKDRYGVGGVVAALEKKFEAITGKEKAVFMPSGTMANQFAIAVLSGEKTKVFVQDTSHVYRDEADAAQSVFQKRLMPLAKGEAFFTADMLRDAVTSLSQQEVFASGVGAVSIENPVRRADGRMVPLEEIKKISAYCRSNNIGLHMDGARIHMAAASSGVPIKEYASYVDTIYISLYKYLGAASGAMLCGDKTVMDKMPHLMKIHGGSMYGNWANAAVALSKLDGIEEKLKQVVQRAAAIFSLLSGVPGIQIVPIDGGTNIYTLELAKNIDGKKFQESLNKQFNIRMARPDDKNQVQITVNETLLFRDVSYIADAFKAAAASSTI